MPKIRYKKIKFSPAHLDVIEKANKIIIQYKAEGYSLTLRQVYYRFVANDFIENNMKSYKRLGDIINNARLGGLIDWYAIEDRTRNLRGLTTWDSPHEIITNAARGFRIDKWEHQRYHVEVWVEKDALVDVVGQACDAHQVSYFSCRGYTSQSEMWAAAQRLGTHEESVVIHLGDHDPSGVDMSRDIEERLNLFMPSGSLFFKRIALNMPQIEQYTPPPNPAKITDSRAKGYIEKFGEDSWELDALEPQVISELIDEEIAVWKNEVAWEAAVVRETALRRELTECGTHWAKVVQFLKTLR